MLSRSKLAKGPVLCLPGDLKEPIMGTQHAYAHLLCVFVLMEQSKMPDMFFFFLSVSLVLLPLLNLRFREQRPKGRDRGSAL